MSATPAIVSHELLLDFVVDGGKVRVPADFTYDAADPYAVQVLFHPTGKRRDDDAWTFARSLLDEGLSGPAGLGDVLIWPEGTEADGTLCVMLSPSQGPILFEARSAAIEEFLEATYSLVTYGAEATRIDLEAELNRLSLRK